MLEVSDPKLYFLFVAYTIIQQTICKVLGLTFIVKLLLVSFFYRRYEAGTNVVMYDFVQ